MCVKNSDNIWHIVQQQDVCGRAAVLILLLLRRTQLVL